MQPQSLPDIPKLPDVSGAPFVSNWAGLCAASAALLMLGSCASAPKLTSSPELSRPTGFAQWNANDAAYRFYPGDQFEVVVYGAPELNRTVTIGPDGRAFMPLAGTFMAASRTAFDVRQELQRLLAPQLVNTALDVSPTTFASQQIFIGGEVGRQGIYPLPGQIDPLQAILIAGGMLDTARTDEILVIRRGANGQAMLKVINIRAGLRDPRALEPFTLQRFDIVFVPKSSIAEINVFVRQYLRDLVGFNVGFSYAINEGQTR